MTTLHGQGVSRGVALGTLCFRHPDPSPAQRREVQHPDEELTRYETAQKLSSVQLDELYTDTAAELGEENALLFQIHQMILEDPDLCAAIHTVILEEHMCAEYAVEQATSQFATQFAAMEDPYMQGRAADVRDVACRLLRNLSGQKETPLCGDSPTILAADDLVPSDTARLDRNKVLAFITAGGSHNSHTSIFARTMGIPAVVGLGVALQDSMDGLEVAVDGSTGQVFLQPDQETRHILLEKKKAEDQRRTLESQFRGKPSISRSGQSLQLCANVCSLEDVDCALENDAEGIGLFRSEFLYLQSSTYPTEEAQFSAYRAVAEKMGGRRVVIRTLDIGADKQAPYFDLPMEENPALGMRAIRICLTRPALFKTQLRALYRASAYGKISIMLPMITHVRELRQSKELAAQAREELRQEGIAFDPAVELGIMIETPAAALLSQELAQEADFFSVGTNDLTQYTLALDRQNRSLTAFDDPAHQAVLQLIRLATESAHQAGIWIGICGELGADETLTETYLRMGIDELSVTPPAILGLRAKLSTL